MGEKYLIGEGGWNAFVQQIQHLVARGYTEYFIVNYPEHKQEKYLKIDEKLIGKYNANLNKDKAYYNKEKKRANFKFLRHGNTAIMLKTKGDLAKHIIIDDAFADVKKEKIRIAISEKTAFLIGYDDLRKVTVYLSKETYREVRATCFEYIKRQKYQKAIDAYNRLNALPAWGGIVDQKISMKERIIQELRKSLSPERVAALSKKMIVSTKRTAVKVF